MADFCEHLLVTDVPATEELNLSFPRMVLPVALFPDPVLPIRTILISSSFHDSIPILKNDILLNIQISNYFSIVKLTKCFKIILINKRRFVNVKNLIQYVPYKTCLNYAIMCSLRFIYFFSLALFLHFSGFIFFCI